MDSFLEKKRREVYHNYAQTKSIVSLTYIRIFDVSGSGQQARL